MPQYLGEFVPPLDRPPAEWSKLEQAGAIALEAEDRYFKHMWPNWPRGVCIDTCLLLAPIIRRELNWDVRIVMTSNGRWLLQACLQTPDGDLIDPTHGMHDGGPALRVLPTSQATTLGHWIVATLTDADEISLCDSLGLTPLQNQSRWFCSAHSVSRT